MANQIPLSGASNAAGGYLLPPEQGEILTNGVLQENGTFALAGDSRATVARKTQFGIWLGTPTAGFVGEGAKKPSTGAEFGQTEINVKKVASIVIFTDEMIEDVQAGDLNVLVDSGVRSAVIDVIDAHGVGKDSGANITTSFDNSLRLTANTGVEYDATKADGLELAVSGALGKLEGAGYRNPANQGLLLGLGFDQRLRDARSSTDTTAAVYAGGRDPFYGRQVEFSTNLNTAGEAAGIGKIIGFAVHKPNLHVRVRKDVTVTPSTEATVSDGVANRNAYEENLTLLRYETRQAFMVHDINNAVVPIFNVA
jgi:hypothetical protein